jgi:hypothetical protein
MSDQTGEPKGTAELDAAPPTAGDVSDTAKAPAPNKVSPTVADVDETRLSAANKPGKTVPGEPPIFDAPMMPVPVPAPAPAPAPVHGHFPARPPIVGAIPPPVYYPPPVAPRDGGSNLGLIIGGLFGGAAVIGGGIALVLVLRSPSTEDPKPIPLDDTAPRTEVKPDVPAGATTEETPSTPPPEPVPAPVVTTPPKTSTKPKPNTQPTAQPTAQPTTQPTTQPTLPPPPEPKSGGRTRPAKKKPQ